MNKHILSDHVPDMSVERNIALRNFNDTTQKYKRWVDRWYYQLGSLECRVCETAIYDKHDVCLYDGKIIHMRCLR